MHDASPHDLSRIYFKNNSLSIDLALIATMFQALSISQMLTLATTLYQGLSTRYAQ
jgi:hypothetical protein